MKHFKYFLALAIAWIAGAISANAAVGDTFTANTTEGVAVTYKVLTENGTTGTVQIGTGSSGGRAISTSTEGSVTIRETVSREVDGVAYTYTVTQVGYQSFDACSMVTSVTLPATIATMSSYVFRGCSRLETVNIPSGASLTSIFEYTFQNCTSLTSFSIPSSVTTIYGRAFQNCSSLSSIDIPASLTTITNKDTSNNNLGSPFDGCTSLARVNITDVVAWNNINFVSLCHPLRKCCEAGNETALYLNGEKITHLVIPEGVTEVKQGPFLYNTGIQTVTIPSTVTIIKDNAFYYPNNGNNVGCPNLRKVVMNSKTLIERNNSNYKMTRYFGGDITEFVLPEGIKTIGNYTFQMMSNLTTVNIPSTVTEICNYAFDRTGLTSLTLPNSLETIGQNAFYDCQALTLTSGVFPSTLTSIGQEAFYNCDGITSVEFQRGLTSIGVRAFYDCQALTLTSGVFPSTLTSIGQEAFYNCDGLTSVEFQSGLTSIGVRAFCDCGSLASITLPFTMRSLNTGVFSGCTALTSITIPEGFTSIGESAFNTCTGLEEVNLPSTLSSIGLYAFQDCHALASITIPRNVSSFGRYAFYNCPILNDVTIQRETPPSQTNIPVFRAPVAGEIVTLKVPMGSESAYSASNGYAPYFTSIIGLPMPGQVITCDDIPYTILTSPEGDTPGTVMLGTGSYNQPAYGSSASGEITVPETVPYTSGDNTYAFNVTTLGSYAFCDCYNVTRINLPATITEIQNYALSTCSSLERLYLASATPNTTIDDYAFYDANTGNCILVVPVGSKAAYQNSRWSSIFPYIKEVGHETDWLPGDVFYATICLGLDSEKTIPFKILTPANGDTPGTVQIGIRDYSNTVPLGEEEPNPSIFEKGDWCPPAITLPDSVEFNNNTYTLTTLGAYVLSTMSSQYDNSKIELPSTITTIGYKAFNYSCWVNDFCAFSETAPILIMGDDPDDDYPAPFGWSFKEATNLIVPDGCTAAYASWAPYFKNVVEKPRPVVIAGVEYKRETDIFGDGTAVLTWELEEGGTIKKAPRKSAEEEDYLYQNGVPVLTLNNANIDYTGNGPAIEVNTFGRFYIRVKGTNTITASNAAAAISIGTNKGVDLSPTSLIFLSDEVPTYQSGGGGLIPGGGEMSAPRRRTAGSGSNANLLPTLTITNSTAGGDGVYVYSGSFNVQDCDVQITASKYGLEFGVDNTNMGEPEASVKHQAPRRKAKNGPKKVAQVPDTDSDWNYIQNPSWLNIFEGSSLTLNGETAALWGALGDYDDNPGYFQNVSLMETDDISTYEQNYTTVEPPYYYPYNINYDYEDEKGSYIFWMTNDDPESSEAEWHYEYAKHLKFGSEFFIATTDEGIRMRFTPTNEDPKECKVGYYNEDGYEDILIPAVDQSTEGSVTIPETANGYDVKSIDVGAFLDCRNLTSVSIPASVEEIEVNAFGNCSSLTAVSCYATKPPTLVVRGQNNEYTPFRGSDTSNMVLYVPESAVTDYLNSTWGQFFNEDNIRPIGDMGYVFTAKTPENVMLTFMVVDVEEGNRYVQVGTGNTDKNSVVSTPNNWDGNLTIPSTVTDALNNTYYVGGIADKAFYNNDDLKALTLEEGVGYVGSGQATWGGNGVFSECDNLSSVTLPSSIYKIDNYAFCWCYALSEVYLYATEIPTLGQNSPFSTSPTLFVPDASVQAYQSAWGESGYFGQILGMSQKPFTAPTPEGVVLKYYVINGPDNTPWVQLGSGQGSAVVSTPANWDGSLTVPAKVTNESGTEYNVIGICDKALCNFSGLRSLTISEGIPYIGSNSGNAAVAYNDNLQTIYLPSSTVALARYAFIVNNNLKDVYLYATTVPDIDSDTFSSWVNATLHVPYGTKVDYVDSGWAQYFGDGERIVEMEGEEEYVEVTIGQYGMATFCSAQPLDFTNVAGLKAYIVSCFDPDTNQLTLTRVNKVYEGTGLLVYGNEGTYRVPVEPTNISAVNMLVGCTEDTYIQPISDGFSKDGKATPQNYTNFVLSKQPGDDYLGFYRFTTSSQNGRRIEAGKAYLQIETEKVSSSSGNIKGFAIVFNDDEPTAITDVEDSRGKIDDAVIYDLSGRRLNKVQKGVNIINGKKVIVK